jgi:hypothetical protein
MEGQGILCWLSLLIPISFLIAREIDQGGVVGVDGIVSIWQVSLAAETASIPRPIGR